jgi:hypothetical protein
MLGRTVIETILPENTENSAARKGEGFLMIVRLRRGDASLGVGHGVMDLEPCLGDAKHEATPSHLCLPGRNNTREGELLEVDRTRHTKGPMGCRQAYADTVILSDK